MLGATWGLSGIESGLLYIALAVFGGASVVGFRVVMGRRKGRALRTMLGVGTIALGGLLIALTVRRGEPPIGHRYEILVVSAWNPL